MPTSHPRHQLTFCYVDKPKKSKKDRLLRGGATKWYLCYPPKRLLVRTQNALRPCSFFATSCPLFELTQTHILFVSTLETDALRKELTKVHLFVSEITVLTD